MSDEHLQPYVDLLSRLAANLQTAGDRAALMAAIYDDFSERNLAEVLARTFGTDPHVMLAEAMAAHHQMSPDDPSVRAMRAALQSAGWEFSTD